MLFLDTSNEGGYTSEEYYAELSLPLVSEDMGLTYMGWGIQDLRVDASYREIENSFSGDYSVDAANIYWQISIPYLSEVYTNCG